MTPKRWKYLKTLTPPVPRLFWASNGGPMPWDRIKGTYDVGRNKAKRDQRALTKVLKLQTRK